MNWSRTDDGGTTTFRLIGSLDAVTTSELRPVVDALVAEKRPKIVVDASGLRLIDSSGGTSLHGGTPECLPGPLLEFLADRVEASWPINVARMGRPAIRESTKHGPRARPPSPGFSFARSLGRL